MNVRDLLSLKGRIAIVTGGRGLYGTGISKGLVEMGATVVIASRNQEKCKEFASSLRDQGYSAYGAYLDLGEDSSIEKLVADVIRKHERIDILVNNAVSYGTDMSLETITREALEATANVNMNGQILLSKEVIAHMIRQGGGNIINISSIRGVDAPHFPLYPAGQSSGISYSGEKWAMVGITKWMAAFYGKNKIRVNCICPGGYNPNMENGMKTDFIKTYEDNCPLGRWATEDDIKGPVVLLASDASGYVTGHTFMMDGGWTIW